jgi:hypothetical protein
MPSHESFTQPRQDVPGESLGEEWRIPLVTDGVGKTFHFFIHFSFLTDR